MRRHKVASGLAILVALSIIGFFVHRTQALPNGPQPVSWDREGCAECHMLISDRRFAAQLQTADGEILNFDDSGCLMTYIKGRHPRIHAIYFRDSQSDRWLPHEEAGFLHTTQSPMGYGLAAVPKTTPRTLSFTDALAKQGGM